MLKKHRTRAQCVPLVQEFLLSQLFVADRCRLHARAAAALEAQPSDRSDGARIAYHYIQAGNTARALIWSVRAGAKNAGWGLTTILIDGARIAH